jgi:hypothetical protein
MRPQTGQGLVLDEVEKSDAKLPPVGYDVVISLKSHRLGEYESKSRCLDANHNQRFFGVYRYLTNLGHYQSIWMFPPSHCPLRGTPSRVR